MQKNLLTLLAWTLPDGARPLVPKDEGSGVMISGFTCRELGFGYKASDDVLDIVNTLRENQKYSDEEAAYYMQYMAAQSSKNLPPLHL